MKLLLDFTHTLLYRGIGNGLASESCRYNLLATGGISRSGNDLFLAQPAGWEICINISHWANWEVVSNWNQLLIERELQIMGTIRWLPLEKRIAAHW